MTCSGFGHRDFYKKIDDELTQIIEDLIYRDSVDTFLTGGMGLFDGKFIRAVNRAKRKRQDVNLILVLPRMTEEINRNKAYYESEFDEVIIPEESSSSYFKSAITKRNRWIVDRSDIIISGVFRDSGGASAAIKYAAAQNKSIIYL